MKPTDPRRIVSQPILFMRILSALLTLALLGAAARAQVPKQYCGDWLLVNGVVILRVEAAGTMTLRNSGDEGALALKDDGSFAWQLKSGVQTGKFAEGKLFLKNEQAGTPKWMAFLEFRRGEPAAANELIEFALQQQTRTMNAFAAVRRSSLEKAILNNLRMIGSAADQYFLENGVNQVKLAQIVGPDKYIKKLTPVDGEDYGKLDLSQGVAKWEIVSASGVSVTYER